MREIKFRVWDNFNKVVRLVWGLGLPDKGNLITACTQIGKFEVPYEFLMQSTGLKDKNSVEIYEKDVIRYNSKKYAVEIPSIYKLLWTGDIVNIEVIGNIYENPELLNNGEIK